MPLPTYFPGEIFEEIISHLSNDMASLQSCTLVSQFFYSIAFRHLFSVIDIDSRDIGHRRRFGRLYKILKESPRAERLASVVKVFKIDTSGPTPNTQLRLDQPDWILYTEPEKIAWILSIMKNMQSLSIKLYSNNIAPPEAPADCAEANRTHDYVWKFNFPGITGHSYSKTIVGLLFCNPSALVDRINPPTRVYLSSLEDSTLLPRCSSVAKLKKLVFILYGRDLLELMKTIANSPSAVLSLSEL
ncbi:hypothetical protein BDQ17DRAFT_1405304 [Cyathus striatus]|nr:hypothetical protein BDQ17DRAFT_1405304 [Cyathus striatus]